MSVVLNADLTVQQVSGWIDTGRYNWGRVQGFGVDVFPAKNMPVLRLRGLGINALYCPFYKTLTGKGSKKYAEQLVKLAEESVELFLKLDAEGFKG